MKKPSIGIIFLTVFIDLIGFGLIFPLIPIYTQNYGAKGVMIGAILASYSLMQFIFSPVWGRLSDRVGRRPVLLWSTASAAICYAIFAWGCTFTGTKALLIILFSRALAGICGANVTVAQAYIADITPPEQRSAKMGLIGMAFGLGFIFGPVIGGFSIQWFGLAGPGWVAAALCAVNFSWAFFKLPESWEPSGYQVPPRPRLNQYWHTLSRPSIGLLAGIFFLATFCFASFESTIGLLVAKGFALNITTGEGAENISYLIAYCGLIGAVIQGGLIKRLVRILGEARLITISLLISALGMVFIPFVQGWGGLLAVLAVFSIGSSLTRAPVFGLLSMRTSAQEQGETMGVAQSVGSLARIAGPLFATALFVSHPAMPYVACGALSLLAALVAWQRLQQPEAEGVKAATKTTGDVF